MVAVLAILVGACSPSGAKDPETTVPTAPTTAATTEVVDPFAVPAVIEAAYVDKVLAALNRVDGDLVRDLVQTNTLSEMANIRLRAIYNDPEFQQELESLVKLFGRGIGGFKRPPGDRRTTVTEIVTASPTCVLAEVTHDYSNVVENAAQPLAGEEVAIVTLRPTQANADPQDLNPTPWSVSNTDIILVNAVPPERARCDAS